MRTCQKKKKNFMSKMYFMGLSVNVIYFEGVKYHIFNISLLKTLYQTDLTNISYVFYHVVSY
jgi:hypothetical protein